MNFRNLFIIVAIVMLAVFGQAAGKLTKDKLKRGAKKALNVASKVAPIVAAGASIARG
uniref:Cecropin 1 n=1 Tax=Simulium bannaense TaxID=1619335 RepID=A0A0S1LIH1_9DIPT|nr:cecropin 1 precursor [Simulium bannaense]